MTSFATTRKQALNGRRADGATKLPAPIPIPVFDENGRRIAEWVEGIDQGRGNAMVPAMSAGVAALQRVRNSLRHERLAEFVYFAAEAIKSGEYEGARYILLTALAAFGWTTSFGEPV